MTTTIDLIPIARSAAKCVFSRRPWLDIDDLEQEAIKAVLEAALRFDPSRGKWEPFARWKAEAHLRHYAMDSTAPVTSKHDRRKLLDVKRASVAAVEALPSRPTLVEDEVRDQLIRERLAKLLGPEKAELAFRVFADEERPREVARREKRTARKVTRELCAIRAVLRSDPVLKEIAGR